LDRHPETAVALAVIRGNPVNLLSQCTLDVGFKGIAEDRWTKEPVDHDEEFSHLGSIIVRKRANCDIGSQVDLPPTHVLVTALEKTYIPRSLQAIQGDIVEPRQEERVRCQQN
jgi:hypothetical protein